MPEQGEQLERGIGTRHRAPRSGRGAGRGKSLSTAAVMMPSVPSAPTKSCFRSYPVLSLRRPRRPFQMRPSGSTTSRPEHEVARIAVAEHVHAAGVGRKIAADHAASFRAQAQRKEAVDLASGLLDVGEHAARFRRQRVVQRIDLADAVHAREREHDLAARGIRHRRAAHPGIAALRDDGRVRFRAELHDAGHFFSRRGPHHRRGCPAIDAAPVDHVRLDVGRRR